jgi:short-subunit dehydrogenase
MKKVIFISGASSGLGQVLAKKLLIHGFKVYGSFWSKKQASLIEGVSYIKLDITQDKSCINAIKKVVSVEKKIDVLINCVGITPSEATTNYSSRQFQNVLQINTIGPFRLIKEVLPIMKNKGGLIINITSLNGFLALPHSGIYSASKFALEALGLSLRNELTVDKINLVNVAPGVFVSEDSAKTIRKNIFRSLFPYTTTTKVADEIVKVIRGNRFPPRIIIGTDAKIAYLLTRVLPLELLDKVIGYLWQKKGSLALRS